jgi:hypothetical protein
MLNPDSKTLGTENRRDDKYHVQLENGTRSGPPEIESVAPGASTKSVFADQLTGLT